MKTNDSCEEMRILVGEYARGESACLDPEERARVEAHLPGCADCREHLASIRDISAALASVREIEVPEDVAERSRQRLDAMLKEKVAQMKAKAETEARESTRPLADEANDSKAKEDRPANIQCFPRWRIAAGIAASVLVAVGAGIWLCREPNAANSSLGRQDVPSRCENVAIETESAQQNPSAVIHAEPSLAGRFSALTDSWDAIELLKTAFESEQQKPQPDFNEIINLSEKLIARWPDSYDVPPARRLIASCYEQMAEAEKARQAFLAYAESEAVLVRRKAIKAGVSETDADTRASLKTASIIGKEADRLLQQSDNLGALALYDILITRYADTEYARHAHFQTGQYYQKIGQPREALAAYRGLIESAPDSPWAKEAELAISTAQLASGDKSAATESLLAYAKEHPADKACAVYNMGVIAMSRGPSYFPQAIEHFQSVQRKYSSSSYAEPAKRNLAALQRNMIDEISKDILNIDM